MSTPNRARARRARKRAKPREAAQRERSRQSQEAHRAALAAEALKAASAQADWAIPGGAGGGVSKGSPFSGKARLVDVSLAQNPLDARTALKVIP